jgi:hypothetical protein
MVDPSALRGLLDDVRATLQRRGAVDVGALSSVIFHDRARVADSVRLILDAAARTDVGSRAGVVSGMVREYHDPRQVTRLRGFFDALETAWSGRVRQRVGEQALDKIRNLLGKPAPDFLGLMRRGFDENANSDVLRWLLDPVRAPHIAPAALSALVGRFENAVQWREAIRRAISNGVLSVRRELIVGRDWDGDRQLDRLDLLISGPGFALAIENKVRASEGKCQTETYWQWLTQLRGLRGGIFLTPFGQPPACPHFVTTSYLDLLGVLVEQVDLEALSTDEEFVLASYLKTLLNHALRTESRVIRHQGDPR